MIYPSAEDIIGSDTWKQVYEQIDAQLWDEHGRVELTDVETLKRIRYCRWALKRIRDELEGQMRHSSLNNLKQVR